jgi:Zn-dependent peptidase ImmA (M78 family)
MGRAISVPINGDVLAWAMAQAGVDDIELAERCKTSPDVIADWREGDQKPTKTQFNRAVARLRRPRAIYFLAEPPEDDPVIRAFRSPPGQEGARQLTDTELRALRTAERLQKIARWIREQRGDQAIAIPQITEATNINDSLRDTHAFLKWQVQDQFDASSASEAARRLRHQLETAGVLVLQFAMKDTGCRGFSLHDDLAPVVAVNSAYTVEARIFSYLHEFAHLARGADSICARLPDSGVERKCERFAAAFLMPRKPFESYVDQSFGPLSQISSIGQVSRVARRFKVSLRATALRLEQIDRAVAGLYDRVDAEADFKGGPGFSRDNSAAAVRLREWGAGYAELLLDAQHRHLLAHTDILEYTNLSSTQLSELRSRVEVGAGAEG